MSDREFLIQNTSTDVESANIQKRKSTVESRKRVFLVASLGFFFFFVIVLSTLIYPSSNDISRSSFESGILPVDNPSVAEPDALPSLRDQDENMAQNWQESDDETVPSKAQTPFTLPDDESNDEKGRNGGDDDNGGEGEGGDDGEGDNDDGEGDNDDGEGDNDDGDDDKDDSIIGRIRRAINEFIDMIVSALIEPFNAIWGWIVSAFEFIMDVLPEPLKFVWGWIVTAFEFFKEITVATYEWIVKGDYLPCLKGYLYYIAIYSILGGLIVPVQALVFASCAGFGPLGIASGSLAAFLMFWLGPITVAGGFVASMQSIGALGFFSGAFPILPLIGLVIGAIVGVIVAMVTSGVCPLVPI
ncbi:hypothetical protein BGZ76_000863 [Entomortierella beljakovae]|nr:hypothetical protein BGZ76_000863 [Entomortierella beljakovae]